MMTEFYSIITKTGLNKLAEANIIGKSVRLTDLAVGDGLGAYYEPKQTQKKLINETHRVNLNRIYIDEDYPNQVIIEAALPEEVGGFFIREVGIFDEAGDLFAIAKYPATFKPSSDSGSGKDLYIRMTLVFSSSPNIEIYENRNNALVSADQLENLALKDLSNVPAAAKNHQGFSNLQGGTKEERYHLTEGQNLTVQNLEGLKKELNAGKYVVLNETGDEFIILPSREIYQNQTLVEGDTIRVTEVNSIYRVPISKDTLLNIDASLACIYGNVVTFEVLIILPQIFNVDFSNSIIWLNGEKPEFDEVGNYLVALRSFNNGELWIGSLQGKF